MMWQHLAHVPKRLARVWREAIADSDLHYDSYLAWREHLARLGVEDVRGLEVLDIGAGDRAPLSLLFAASGARVTSLDILPVAFGWRRPTLWFGVARSVGPGRAIVIVVRDFLHTFRYWRHLGARASARLPFNDLRLVRGDASRLPFPDSTFDLVLSSAVWEHLSDVARATQEVNRVLRPGGITAIQIALFPALQGGHHPEWHTTEPSVPRAIRPWDHLYADRRPLPTYLNEWRERQYRDVFQQYLDVIEWEDGAMTEPDLLSDEVQSALSAFSDRDLLLPALTAWAKPRRPSIEPGPSAPASAD